MREDSLRRLLRALVGTLLFVLGYWVVNLAGLLGAWLRLVPRGGVAPADPAWAGPFSIAIVVIGLVGVSLVFVCLRRGRGG